MRERKSSSSRRRCGRLEQSRVLSLLHERIERARPVGGGDDDVRLRSGDHALGSGAVDRTVERDDPAERGQLVGLERALVGGRGVGGDGDAARVGVLDDGARRRVAEVVRELPGRLGVVVVEIREREAAVLGDGVPPRGGAGAAVARRLLVRVLAVSQLVVGSLEREDEMARQQLVAFEPADDGGVVRGGVRERLEGETPAGLVGRARRRGPRSSPSTASYCSGLVTTPTQAWFFAAARTMAGPPMSMVSMSGRSRNG